MRLLNVHSLQLEEHFEPTPKYAILSHRWEEEEITFTDIQNQSFKHKKAYKKLKYTCYQATQDDLHYVWIDTFCIDKSSSADLSEAINSMFRWYQEAEICYAYLSDAEASFSLDSNNLHGFERSIWFTRGWTLQELIAPRTVQFYDRNWSPIGTRDNFSDRISGITGIAEPLLRRRNQVLQQRALLDYSVAQRMSWAANRQTTRIEDYAYPLMGLFGVNMPLLYGEGERAFIRLQEEIIKTGTDLSILAWENRPHLNKYTPLLAPSPRNFRGCGRIQRIPRDFSQNESNIILAMTNIGLRLDNPQIEVTKFGKEFSELTMSLECYDTADVTGLIGLRVSTKSPNLLNSHTEIPKVTRLYTACELGWGGNGLKGEGERLARFPIERSGRPIVSGTVVLPREREISQVQYRIHTHVCIQCSGLTVIAAKPEACWDQSTQTFDLRQSCGSATYMNTDSLHTVTNQVSDVERQVFGLVLLKDEDDRQFTLYFRRTVNGSDSEPYSKKVTFVNGYVSEPYSSKVTFHLHRLDSTAPFTIDPDQLEGRWRSEGESQVLSQREIYRLEASLRSTGWPGIWIANLSVRSF